MARTIFLLLILLNLLMLAWVYLKGDERINAGREPQRIKTVLAADKVRILLPTEDTPPGISAGLSIVPAATADDCRAYAGATPAEAQEILKAWTAKLSAARIVATPVMPPKVFDIAIAGLASRVAAEAKQAELKKLGFSDGVQINFGEDKHFSLLIASFADRGAADDALKTAVKKGVRSAAVVERQPVPVQATIEVHGSDAVIRQLPELAASYKGLSPLSCNVARSTS